MKRHRHIATLQNSPYAHISGHYPLHINHTLLKAIQLLSSPNVEHIVRHWLCTIYSSLHNYYAF